MLIDGLDGQVALVRTAMAEIALRVGPLAAGPGCVGDRDDETTPIAIANGSCRFTLRPVRRHDGPHEGHETQCLARRTPARRVTEVA
jgi:hypothetical protein